MAANTAPIFSKVGDIQGGVTLISAAADYTGASVNNSIVFQADATNGGFLQKLRFKAIGTNAATVARIYINEGYVPVATTVGTPAGLAGTPSSSGGSLQPATYYAKLQGIDQWGAPGAFSAEASATTTGTTGSIAWAWTALTGAVSYRLFVGPATGSQVIYFTSSTNSYSMTTATINLTTNLPAQGVTTDFTTNNLFYGECSLPATTAATTSATVDIDYPMNIALPPAFHIVVGLGAAVAAGWVVTGIAGKY